MKKILAIGLLAALAAVGLLFVFLQMRTPSHDGSWQTSQAVLPEAEIDGDRIEIRDLRNFTYGPDGSVSEARYEARAYDLSELTSLWYGISHFAGYGLAHTFVSFGFEDGRYLALSIEARRRIGQSYNPLLGLLRSYELIYVAADERDVIGVRSHLLDERVHLYQVLVDPRKIRTLLLTMLAIMNEIHEKPRFYNTLTDNCTTNILQHAEKLSSLEMYLDYRALLPGYSDALLYELAIIPNDLPLEALRAGARIDPATVSLEDPDFSRKIRGL